jgi:uncharacterized RDD family membrane protein YckC
MYDPSANFQQAHQPLSGAQAASPRATQTVQIAPLMRRLSAALYESALVFGIYFVPAYLYLSVSQTRLSDTIQGGPRLWAFQAFIFIVFAVYFGWSWSQGRRTLPQKTWGVRVMMKDGTPLTQARAVLRYTLAWFSLGCGLLGFFYALVDKDKAFLHDRLLGTRIVIDETGAAYGARK